MPIPSLRFRLWQVALLVLLIAGGAAAWFFLVRDSDEGSKASEGSGDKKREKPLSDDPLVRRMSRSEQVDQVLLLGFEGTAANADGVRAAAGAGLGGLLVRTENWPGLENGRKLVAALGQGGRIPPLVAVSQEGGEFRSLPDLPPDKRALDMARTGKPEAVEAWARSTSSALANAGFDLNLFPVADVATLDSPLAGRAFSDDAAEVASLTEAALAGCEDTGLVCAPLHFPGLGLASQDTGVGPATVAADLATLEERDFVPFATGPVRKSEALVLSLGLYPDFDPVVPGALTPEVATDLLRDEFRFRGVAISDDLGAGAVTANSSVPKAAVAALKAGIDLIQIGSPEDAAGVAGALAKAVKKGDVPAERLAQAAARVVALKRKLGLVR